MARGLGGHSPANVQLYLKGIEYPASKDELLRAARSNDAPDEVIDVIKSLSVQQFGGPQDVMKAYGHQH